MKKPDNIIKQDWELLLQKYDEKTLETKLKENYPIQYLIGDVLFVNCKIKVDERCLIPRFETELLTVKTLNLIETLDLKESTIVDLCTGSGCIAIVLSKCLKKTIDAIEISEKAIEIATENKALKNYDVNLIKADILKLKSLDYDVIISNPPYVSLDEPVAKATKYEPQNALYAKNQGLEFYEHILSIANQNTKLIAFEIGCSQGEKLKNIAKTFFPQAEIRVEKDFTNRDRFLFIINK